MKKFNVSYIITVLLIILFSTIQTAALTFTTNKNYSKSYNLIYASGRIYSGDLYRLKQSVNSLPRNKQIIVVFNSMGGELNEGIKLGKYIYRNKIATAVQNSSICASSCAIAFLGGRDLYGRKMMILPSSSKLGYHSFYYKSSNSVKVSKIQKDLSNVVNYFSYVGASNNLMSKMLNTNSSKMYWITRYSNRYLKLRKGIRIKDNSNTRRASAHYNRSREVIARNSKYTSQKDALKKYFYEINQAVTSNRGYSYRNVALNNYKAWLESNLNYVYVKKIKKLSRNTLEAKVIYSLKNGSKIYSNNRYKLAKSSSGWYIASKKVLPLRSYRRAAKSIKHNLP